MPEKLETFEFQRKTGKAGRPSKYPWNEWLNGTTWKLTPAELAAANVTATSFRGSLYAQARKRGLVLNVNIIDETDGEAIVFRASDPNVVITSPAEKTASDESPANDAASAEDSVTDTPEVEDKVVPANNTPATAKSTVAKAAPRKK